MEESVETEGSEESDEQQSRRLPTAQIEGKADQPDDGLPNPDEINIRPSQPGRQIGVVTEEFRVVREVQEAGGQIQRQKHSQAHELVARRRLRHHFASSTI